MEFTITVWTNFSEAGGQGDPLTQVRRFSGLTFETLVNGGFGGAEFTIETTEWSAAQWYESYLGFHIVIFDSFGRRVYEGRIESISYVVNKGIQVSCLGYYTHAQDLTHGIIYPIGTPKSISDIIEETIDLSNQWWTNKTGIEKTTIDITPQDFTGEQKLIDAIEECLKYGNDATPPKPMYFTIWEHRQPFLFSEPALTNFPDWQVYLKDIEVSQALSLSRSKENLYNRIQVLYDDPDIGPTFTDWKDDTVSQSLFGIREGSLNIGSSLPGVADVIAELAIENYANPEQSSTLKISGRVRSKSHNIELPYLIRAGELLRINDFDPSIAQQTKGTGGLDSNMAVVQKTSYNVERNSMSVTLGKKNVLMDILLARIGKSSASIR